VVHHPRRMAGRATKNDEASPWIDATVHRHHDSISAATFWCHTTKKCIAFINYQNYAYWSATEVRTRSVPWSFVANDTLRDIDKPITP
jgi:hypothetical protein